MSQVFLDELNEQREQLIHAIISAYKPQVYLDSAGMVHPVDNVKQIETMEKGLARVEEFIRIEERR